MSLQDWLKFGWLKEHKTSRQEIADLFAVADRDLKACQPPDLVPDWQFNIAYNAAPQLATAALAAAGYQAERSSHHYRVIQSLELTIGADAGTIRKLEFFRKKRNITGYERADAVSELEAEEMRKLRSLPWVVLLDPGFDRTAAGLWRWGRRRLRAGGPGISGRRFRSQGAAAPKGFRSRGRRVGGHYAG